MTTVHYSLVYCWSGNRSGCSIDEPKALLQLRSFGMHSSSKGFCVQPDKVQISQEMTKSVIYIINYLDFTNYNKISSILFYYNILLIVELGSLHTVAKIRLSSHSVRPNKATRSQSLFGYVSLRNMTINASIPVAVVPCLQMYWSGRLNAIARHKISSLENL